MNSYTVIRKRAYWVREVMHVDANTHQEAEDAFHNEFDPELIIEDVCRPSSVSSAIKHPDQLYKELEVIENEQA
tara:strand:- start:138 stop:359 length:222 start_codon:yes stop_codon:yes gene_type:complete